MLLLQKTGFLLDITDWIRVLNQRICHQTTLTWTLRITAFWKIWHKDCINIKGLGICNTWRIYWKKNGKNYPNTRVMHASISLNIIYLSYRSSRQTHIERFFSICCWTKCVLLFLSWHVQVICCHCWIIRKCLLH